jgi:hypothetical protein
MAVANLLERPGIRGRFELRKYFPDEWHCFLVPEMQNQL